MTGSAGFTESAVMTNDQAPMTKKGGSERPLFGHWCLVIDVGKGCFKN
jgi:hypothetical protein